MGGKKLVGAAIVTLFVIWALTAPVTAATEIIVDDVTDTRFGRYMTSDHRLEVELKLSKDRSADSYGYSSDVRVDTRSPINVTVAQSTQATIDVTQPGEENKKNGRGNSQASPARGVPSVSSGDRIAD